MGKSASGKDTIYKKILERESSIRGIVIYTTRPKRDGEIDGYTYHFVDNEYIEIHKNSIIEKRVYNTKFGNWIYATIDDGQFDFDGTLICIGTLESYQICKEYFGEDRMFPVYIEIDDEIRFERAIQREDVDELKLSEIKRRFMADNIDFSEEKLMQAGIEKIYVNNCIDNCVNEILNDLGGKVEGI